jgi:hypothetical protein
MKYIVFCISLQKKAKIPREECILLNIFVKAQTCYAKSQSSPLIAGNKRETWNYVSAKVKTGIDMASTLQVTACIFLP